MRRNSEQLIYSPSDLTRFNESPFASWMERFHLENPGLYEKDSLSDEVLLFQQAGIEHEAQVLDELKSQNRDLAEIDKLPVDQDKFAATLQAIQERREVIYQASLGLTPFAGIADFLVRSEQESDMYEVWDTKLAKSPKPYFLLQLCCYAEMLEPILGKRPTYLAVFLGSNKIQYFRTDDYYFYYQRVKQAFLKQMQEFDPRSPPPVPDPSKNHGVWSSRAEDTLLQKDHLFQVANITSSQIVKLNAAGISTLTQLATEPVVSIPGLSSTQFKRLRKQATLQLKGKDDSIPHLEVLPYEQGDREHGLLFLPPESPLDVYFDIEGYPLVNNGLEYLFGAITIEGSKAVFKDWWAHDAAAEKQAFENFVDWVMDRFRRDHSMHIYHYASYEVSALRRLMGKYATREDEIDELLRAEVFVDLYQIIKNSVLVGGPNYSLKTIEKVYHPSVRDGGVTTASGSVVAYAKWIASGESGDPQQSVLLQEIRDYNRIDCESTWGATKWLRSLQEHYRIPYISRATIIEENDNKKKKAKLEILVRRQQLAQELMQRIPESDLENPTGDSFFNMILAQLLEFHRRETKPVFWAKFDRAKRTDEELIEDLACLGGLTLVSGSPGRIDRSLGFRYHFEASQDTKIAPGQKAFFSHDIGVSVTVHDIGEGEVVLKVGSDTYQQKLNGNMPEHCSLIPNEYVCPEAIENAIDRLVRDWADSSKIPSAFRQLLLREFPKVNGVETAENLRKAGETFVDASIRLARGLNHSTLVIQGPPGTGKTYTAAATIVALLRDGKNVGITSNSHKAIQNLVEAVVLASNGNFSNLGHLRGLVVTKDRDQPVYEKNSNLLALSDSGKAVDRYTQGLLAGTAWLFAREELEDRLDYLFVDEAGQVSLANLAGMCRATKNIVLLGDQMQLGQPTQGSHPGESGLSLLDYYLRDHAVVPPQQGVFLAESRRMHPDICQFVSEAFYEGSLNAWEGASSRSLVIPEVLKTDILKTSGIRFVDVPHVGNVQGSDEEVEVIRKITNQLLECSWCENAGQAAVKMTLDNILYVAPYNLQVRKLRQALPAGAKVGSVDKFQGQEAAVVIVSMCASAGEFGSRGLKFLLDTNRLNVAISRAKVLAIVVADGRISESQANSVEDMKLVNLFCRLCNYGR